MEITEEMGFMCAKCRLINVLPQEIASVNKEENKCRCGGILLPIGYARVVSREKKTNAVVITMKADTTEIDAAIVKANELKEILKECGVIGEQDKQIALH